MSGFFMLWRLRSGAEGGGIQNFFLQKGAKGR